ncbi:phosphatidylethanolamine-binding protein [Russula vinacea]|nr:phosphatidylethanolamine-binding protein [Russula vinacea]
MFLFATTVALSFLGPLVNAQSTNDTALGIAAIEAHFTNAKLVPDLLATFDPGAIMTVTFSGVGAISPGQNLTTEQVAAAPELTIVPANSSVSLTGNYTLVMADADIVGTNESVGQTRHWLVNGVTLKSGNSSNSSSSSSPLNVSTTGGVAVTEYAGPAPPQGSGPHRYVILLLPQPSSFSPPSNLSKPGVAVSVFNLDDYISTSHLGEPVAGMYFEVQQGATDSNITIPATSAVVSSTLKPVTPATSTASSSASAAKQSGTKNAANRSGNSLFAIPASFVILLASYIYL